ncbi:MAG: putative DNA binding domain-containing protein [Candidatus Gastranaerophilales bacterium]|nr:putative DNA binding domain-containing protein [Candidatus Gastranaerophilales bacterium]MCM1525737.1 putative DNA binding domain-containing protein [Bacteroides sp.]
MSDIFDLSRFDEYREDNRREVKRATGGLPISLWDTYSAFANCYGGVIILGIKEEKDGSWKTTGLQNVSKLCKDFWDTINNSKKVSVNLLSEDDVQTYETGYNKDVIMVIYVPMAKREQNRYKIIKDVKVPFKMSGGERVDDTPVHKALREALANCLINADYHGLRGVVIRKEADKLILANPGYIRTGKKQMRIGGESDPRNKALMKMFNLINIGERAGSGVPNIFNIWADEGWEEPVIEEKFDPDRTVLSLSFVKKVAKKSDGKKVTEKKWRKKVAKKK